MSNKLASNNKSYAIRQDLFERETSSLNGIDVTAYINWKLESYIYEEHDLQNALPVVVLGKDSFRCPFCQSNKCFGAGPAKTLDYYPTEGKLEIRPHPFLIAGKTGKKQLELCKCISKEKYFFLETAENRLYQFSDLRCVSCPSDRLRINLIGKCGIVSCRQCHFSFVIACQNLQELKKLEMKRKGASKESNILKS